VAAMFTRYFFQSSSESISHTLITALGLEDATMVFSPIVSFNQLQIRILNPDCQQSVSDVTQKSDRNAQGFMRKQVA
jgi:hypothetical protein